MGARTATTATTDADTKESAPMLDLPTGPGPVWPPGSEPPNRPRIRPYLRTLVLDQDRMLVKGGTSTVLLSGPSVEDVAAVILPSLDGSRTVEEVAADFSWIEPSVVIQAINLFSANGLLEDANTDLRLETDGSMSRYQYQTTYWLSVAGDRYSHQDRLASSTVMVLGLGGVGAAVALALTTAGVGHLVLHDHEPLTPADALFGYPSHSDNRSRTQALRERLAQSNPLVTTDVVPRGSSPTRAPDLDGADLVVFCSDGSPTSGSDKLSLAVCEGLNRSSLETGVPWTRAVVDHHQGVVGPTVVPFETPCLTCFRLRLRSNMSINADALAYDRHLATTEAPVAPALLGPFATLVGAYAAVEAIKQLTQFARPSSIGAFVALNSLTGECTRHDVLRLPRCPDCGPSRDRPQMKIWDIRKSS